MCKGRKRKTTMSNGASSRKPVTRRGSRGDGRLPPPVKCEKSRGTKVARSPRSSGASAPESAFGNYKFE